MQFRKKDKYGMPYYTFKYVVSVGTFFNYLFYVVIEARLKEQVSNKQLGKSKLHCYNRVVSGMITPQIIDLLWKSRVVWHGFSGYTDSVR